MVSEVIANTRDTAGCCHSPVICISEWCHQWCIAHFQAEALWNVGQAKNGKGWTSLFSGPFTDWLKTHLFSRNTSRGVFIHKIRCLGMGRDIQKAQRPIRTLLLLMLPWYAVLELLVLLEFYVHFTSNQAKEKPKQFLEHGELEWVMAEPYLHLCYNFPRQYNTATQTLAVSTMAFCVGREHSRQLKMCVHPRVQPAQLLLRPQNPPCIIYGFAAQRRSWTPLFYICHARSDKFQSGSPH